MGNTNNLSYGNIQMNQIEIDWEQQQQSAVLLDEFEHPIEVKIKSLKNICNAPRYVYQKKYSLILLRIELMFGSKVFDECSWDIRIPHAQISDNLKIPSAISTFSSELGELYYSMLPREATWCFTVYGVKENEESGIDSENDKKTKKNKKTLKHINTTTTSQPHHQMDNFISVSSEFRLFNKSSKQNQNMQIAAIALVSQTHRTNQAIMKLQYCQLWILRIRLMALWNHWLGHVFLLLIIDIVFDERTYHCIYGVFPYSNIKKVVLALIRILQIFGKNLEPQEIEN